MFLIVKKNATITTSISFELTSSHAKVTSIQSQPKWVSDKGKQKIGLESDKIFLITTVAEYHAAMAQIMQMKLTWCT